MEKINGVTTVVGSFPLENTPENMERAFKDQIEAGIDYPCYPQLVSMIGQFLDPLCAMDSGLVKRDGKYYLESELKIPDKAFATEYGDFVLNFFKKYPDTRDKIKGWKACLTGPFTLAGEIHIDESLLEGKRIVGYQDARGIMVGEIVEKLAKMMSKIARAYDDMGASIISMDEPTLALIVGRRKAFYHSDEEIVSHLNTAIEPISKFSSIHVCGRVSPKLIEILLKSNVRIHDHEFANGSNLDNFRREMFEGTNKTLAVGVVESLVIKGESLEPEKYIDPYNIVKERIQVAIERFGAENVMFKPDCGFGGLLASFGEELGLKIVYGKMKNMNDALKEVKSGN